MASETPPKYSRVPAGSKLDSFKEWICEQLRESPTIQAQRLREMAAELGYEGGKTILDEYVREVRPRFQVRRTFQRTSSTGWVANSNSVSPPEIPAATTQTPEQVRVLIGGGGEHQPVRGHHPRGDEAGL